MTSGRSFTALLQRIPASLRVKNVFGLVIILLVSPILATYIERVIVEIYDFNNFNFAVYISMGINLITTGLIILYLLNATVLNPLKQVITTAEEVGKGNLLVAASLQSQDEMGRLAGAIAAMIENLKGLIAKINVTANANAEKSAAITELITGSISAVEQVAAGTNELAGNAEKVSAITKEMSEVAGSVAADAAAGEGMLNSAAQAIAASREKVMASVEKVSTLSDLSRNINKMVGLIADIAERTNLLSLNATIEAARAGEHGRGFAVVAEEVRELAEQSKNAAREIANTVGEMEEATKLTVSSINESETMINNSFDIVTQTVGSIKDILHSVGNINERTQAIAGNAEGIASFSQEAAAATEEQASSLHNISSLVEDFNASAAGLKQLLAEFRV